MAFAALPLLFSNAVPIALRPRWTTVIVNCAYPEVSYSSCEYINLPIPVPNIHLPANFFGIRAIIFATPRPTSLNSAAGHISFAISVTDALRTTHIDRTPTSTSHIARATSSAVAKPLRIGGIPCPPFAVNCSIGPRSSSAISPAHTVETTIPRSAIFHASISPRNRLRSHVPRSSSERYGVPKSTRANVVCRPRHNMELRNTRRLTPSSSIARHNNLTPSTFIAHVVASSASSKQLFPIVQKTASLPLIFSRSKSMSHRSIPPSAPPPSAHFT